MKKNNISSRNKSFNNDPYVRESHNCYSYFLNLHSDKAENVCKNELNIENYCRRSQPGYASGFPSLKKRDFTCSEIVKRTLADNPKMFKTTRNKKCPNDYYKGAVVVAPETDYHYYRLNDEGVWTHKPGYKPSTFLDASNNIIRDPKVASRNYGKELNYTDFCGYTCVPRNPMLKHMKMDSIPPEKIEEKVKKEFKIEQHNKTLKEKVKEIIVKNKRLRTNEQKYKKTKKWKKFKKIKK